MNRTSIGFSLFLALMMCFMISNSVFASDLFQNTDPPPAESPSINVNLQNACKSCEQTAYETEQQVNVENGSYSVKTTTTTSGGSDWSSEGGGGSESTQTLNIPGSGPGQSMLLNDGNGNLVRVLTTGAGSSLGWIKPDKDYINFVWGSGKNPNDLHEDWCGFSNSVPQPGVHNVPGGAGTLFGCPDGTAYAGHFSGGVFIQDFTYVTTCTTTPANGNSSGGYITASQAQQMTNVTQTSRITGTLGLGNLQSTNQGSSTSCTVTKYPIVVGSAACACQWTKQRGGTRWWDSYDEIKTYPTQRITIIKGYGLRFNIHYYNQTIDVPYPCPTVIRNPYPRAIAGQPAQFILNKDVFVYDGAVIPSCTPDIKNYKFSVKMEQDAAYKPVWVWKDRAWSSSPGQDRGWKVTHIFDTASFNLFNTLGPGLTTEKLPSYDPTVMVKWNIYTARNWIDAFGRGQGTGWVQLDLRDYGFPDQGFIMEGAKDVTPPPPGVPPFLNPKCTFPVPVIESQGLVSSSGS